LAKFIKRLFQAWVDDLQVRCDVEPLRNRDIVVHLNRVLVLPLFELARVFEDPLSPGEWRVEFIESG
jgi:hypothetical protein